MMPKSDKGKKQFVCSCGYKKETESVKLTEAGKKVEEVAVVEKEEVINPIADIDCKKCDNKEAETWEIQTRSSDEPPTKFYRCTKCKHTWRDYS